MHACWCESPLTSNLKAHKTWTRGFYRLWSYIIIIACIGIIIYATPITTYHLLAQVALYIT